MKFSYNWINSLLDNRLPEAEELARIVNSRLFEVDKLEKQGNDWLIDLDILPSRSGDCLSHLGVAGEIAVILNLELKNPLSQESTFETPGFPVEVSDFSDCPRYMAMTISDIKVAPSPDWIREKLEVCGMQSINNIVDIANYVMLETGQPLHLFDKSKISNKIIVRRAKEGEKMTTLDNKEYLLNDQILLITDDSKPLAIAGIKGGKDAEVTTETQEIIIESASFNRKVVRRGSAFLKLRTDASIRFEYGFDINLNESALTRVASLVSQIAGGKISNRVTDLYLEKPIPKTIELDPERVKRVIGLDLTKERMVDVLSSLGFKTDQDLKVEVPTRRIDVSIQEDLIEEIGRVIGYEKIEPVLPKIEISVPKRDKALFWEEKVKDLLVTAGFTEIYSHSFISEKEAKGDLFEVESPVSIEQRYLRSSIISQIIKTVENNKRFFDKVKIFELGKVFDKERGERRSLAGAITGDSFSELKGALDFISGESGLKFDYMINQETDPYFIQKADIIIDNDRIGSIGYISDFTAFELDFNKIIEKATEEKVYQPIAKYPESTRDLAVIVPEEFSFKDLLDQISSPLLKKIELFDLYRGEGIPEGKKSFALHLIFSADRTLKAEEISDLFNEIIDKLEKNKDLQIRR